MILIFIIYITIHLKIVNKIILKQILRIIFIRVIKIFIINYEVKILRFWRKKYENKILVPNFDNILNIEIVLREEMKGVLNVIERRLFGNAIIFGGELLIDPKIAIKILKNRLEPYGYLPFLKRDGSKFVIQILPAYAAPVKKRVMINIILFIITIFTTLLSGALLRGVNPFNDFSKIIYGMPFSFTLMAILGIHELGHYYFSKKHGMEVTLPYFIPVPPYPFLLGTLGAFIKMKSPVENRSSLFDIGAAGPIAGVSVAIPSLVVGLMLSEKVIINDVTTGVMLGESLLMKLITRIVVGTMPENVDILLHPVGFAGWIGLLVTGINLLPIGQLDGGHVTYSILGKNHRLVSYIAFLSLFILGIFWPGWFTWAILLLIMGLTHTPPLDDVSQLDRKRKIIGYFLFILLFLIIPPVPFKIK